MKPKEYGFVVQYCSRNAAHKQSGIKWNTSKAEHKQTGIKWNTSKSEHKQTGIKTKNYFKITVTKSQNINHRYL